MGGVFQLILKPDLPNSSGLGDAFDAAQAAGYSGPPRKPGSSAHTRDLGLKTFSGAFWLKIFQSYRDAVWFSANGEVKLGRDISILPNVGQLQTHVDLPFLLNNNNGESSMQLAARSLR